MRIAGKLLLTNYLLRFFERKLVDHGYYHLTTDHWATV